MESPYSNLVANCNCQHTPQCTDSVVYRLLLFIFQGDQGERGSPGTDGVLGMAGPPGPSGDPGESGLAGGDVSNNYNNSKCNWFRAAISSTNVKMLQDT